MARRADVRELEELWLKAKGVGEMITLETPSLHIYT